MSAPVELERTLPPSPASAGEARRLLREVLSETGAGDWVDNAQVAVSELVTNALVHAGTPIRLHVQARRDGLRVEVADGSPHLPRQRAYAATSGTGRGLHLLEELVDSWGALPDRRRQGGLVRDPGGGAQHPATAAGADPRGRRAAGAGLGAGRPAPGAAADAPGLAGARGRAAARVPPRHHGGRRAGHRAARPGQRGPEHPLRAGARARPRPRARAGDGRRGGSGAGRTALRRPHPRRLARQLRDPRRPARRRRRSWRRPTSSSARRCSRRCGSCGAGSVARSASRAAAPPLRGPGGR